MTAGEGLLIPAGLPHHNRNVSDRPQTHLEVIAPGIRAGSPPASGTLEVGVALQHHTVGPNTLVVLPSGVPHSQGNPSEVPERHLAVLVPEPPLPNSAEHPWDTVVDFGVAARQLH